MTSPYDENWNLDIAPIDALTVEQAQARLLAARNAAEWKSASSDLELAARKAPRSVEGDATHEWRADLGTWVACGKCGIVRRADRLHRPCAGHPPVISPRAHRCNGGRA